MAPISWTDLDDGKGRVVTDKKTESNHIGTDAAGQAIYETKEVERTREVRTADVVQVAEVDGVKLLRIVNRSELADHITESTVALVRLS